MARPLLAHPRSNQTLAGWLMAAGLGLALSACGGSSTIEGGAAGRGSGGGGAVGGAPGSAGSSPAGSCEVNGIAYPSGRNGIPSADGCNTCSCSEGNLRCTARACPPSKTCGGMLPGGTCGKGQYCNFPPTAGCGAGDQTGECTPLPSACPEIYAPVCGCDNHTYDSACSAAAAGVSVTHLQPCDPACIVGDVSYPSGSSGIPASDGCNVCSCAAGKLACTLINCPERKSCGARAGNTCTSNEYCAYTEGGLCGAADAESVCKPRPGACTANYDPICGCDGKTYGNSCSAALAGSGVLHAGPCSGKGRSCVVDGVTYADGDGNIPASDGCNICTCTDGSLTCTKRACPVPVVCGGITGAVCGSNQYCAYVPGQLCGAADASSTCRTRPDACTSDVNPVCGCDGKDYSNPCEAARNGVGYSRAGNCIPLK